MSIQTISFIKDEDSDSIFAVIVSSGKKKVAYGSTSLGKYWSNQFNSTSKLSENIEDSIGHQYYVTKPQTLNEGIINSLQEIISDSDIEKIRKFEDIDFENKSLFQILVKTDPDINNEDNEYIQIFQNNDEDKFDISDLSISDLPISFIDVQFKQNAINYKTKAFNLDRQLSSLATEVKGVRAVWDPDARNGIGAWRCPDDTPAGGQFTNRVGKGCTWGATRRLGRGLVAAAGSSSSRLAKLGETLEERGERRSTEAREAAADKSRRRIERRILLGARARDFGESVDKNIDMTLQQLDKYLALPVERYINRQLQKLNKRKFKKGEARRRRRGISGLDRPPIVLNGKPMSAENSYILRWIQNKNKNLPKEQTLTIWNLENLTSSSESMPNSEYAFPLYGYQSNNKKLGELSTVESDKTFWENLDNSNFENQFDKIESGELDAIKTTEFDSPIVNWLISRQLQERQNNNDDWFASQRTIRRFILNMDKTPGKTKRQRRRENFGQMPKDKEMVQRLSSRVGKGEKNIRLKRGKRKNVGLKRRPSDARRVKAGTSIERLAQRALTGKKTTRPQSLRVKRRKIINQGKTSAKFFAKDYVRPDEVPDISSLTKKQRESLDQEIFKAFDEVFDKLYGDMMLAQTRGKKNRRKQFEKLRAAKNRTIDYSKIVPIEESGLIEGEDIGRAKTHAHNLEVLDEIIKTGDYDKLNDVKPAVRQRILVNAGLVTAAPPKQPKKKAATKKAAKPKTPASKPTPPPAPPSPPTPPPAPPAPPTPPTPPPTPPTPPSPPTPSPTPLAPDDDGIPTAPVPPESPTPDVVEDATPDTKPRQKTTRTGDDVYKGVDVSGLKPINVSSGFVLWDDENTNRVVDISDEINFDFEGDAVPEKFTPPAYQKKTFTYPRAQIKLGPDKRTNTVILPNINAPSDISGVKSLYDSVFIFDPDKASWSNSSRIAEPLPVIYKAIEDYVSGFKDKDIKDITDDEFLRLLNAVDAARAIFHDIALDENMFYEAPRNVIQSREDVDQTGSYEGNRRKDYWGRIYSNLRSVYLNKSVVASLTSTKFDDLDLTSIPQSSIDSNQRLAEALNGAIFEQHKFGSQAVDTRDDSFEMIKTVADIFTDFDNFKTQNPNIGEAFYAVSPFFDVFAQKVMPQITGDINMDIRISDYRVNDVSTNYSFRRGSGRRGWGMAFQRVHQNSYGSSSVQPLVASATEALLTENPQKLKESLKAVAELHRRSVNDFTNLLSQFHTSAQQGTSFGDKKRRMLVQAALQIDAAEKLMDRFTQPNISKIISDAAEAEFRMAYANLVASLNRSRDRAERRAAGTLKVGGAKSIDELGPKPGVNRTPLEIERLHLDHVGDPLFSPAPLGPDGLAKTPRLTKDEIDYFETVQQAFADRKTLDGRVVGNNSDAGSRAEIHASLELNGYNDYPVVVNEDEWVSILTATDDSGNPMFYYGTRWLRPPDGETAESVHSGYISGPRYVWPGAQAYGRGEYFAGDTGAGGYGDAGYSFVLHKDAKAVEYSIIQQAGQALRSKLAEMARYAGVNMNSSDANERNRTARTRDELQDKAESLQRELLDPSNRNMPTNNDRVVYPDLVALTGTIIDYWTQLELAKIPNPRNIPGVTAFNQRITNMQKHLYFLDESGLAIVLGADMMYTGDPVNRLTDALAPLSMVFGADRKMQGTGHYMVLLNRTKMITLDKPLTRSSISNLYSRLNPR